MNRFEFMLSQLAPAHAERFRRAAGIEEVAAGERVVVEGSQFGAMRVVERGRVAISTRLTGDSPLDTLGAGDVFGDISFLDRRAASATFTALEGCRLLVIGYGRLEELMRESEGFRGDVMRMLAQMMAARVRKFIDLRVAYTLETVKVTHSNPGWSGIESALAGLKSALRYVDSNPLADMAVPATCGSAEVVEAFRSFCAELKRVFHGPGDTLPAGDVPRLGNYLREEFLPFSQLAETLSRIIECPRGYHPDAVTLQMIGDGGGHGRTRIGRALDAAFLTEPVCHALRRRQRQLGDKLRELCESASPGGSHVAVLAPGMADEPLGAVARSPGALKLSLVESDPDALEYLDARLETGGGAVSVIESSLQQQPGEPALPGGLPPQHAILALHSLDRLADDAALRLLDACHERLADDGMLVVAALDPGNGSLAFLEHMLGWKVHARDEQALNGLLTRSRFGRPCGELRSDDETMDRLAVCRK